MDKDVDEKRKLKKEEVGQMKLANLLSAVQIVIIALGFVSLYKTFND